MASKTRRKPPKRRQSPTPDETFAGYKPSERLVYSYFDGQQQRLADPLILYQRISEKTGTLEHCGKVLSQTGEGFDVSAFGTLAASVREIFGVKSFDEGGLLDEECLGLLDHFMRWGAAVKKKRDPSPISAKSTAAPSWADSITPSSLASTSTAPAPSTDAPSPSPSE